MEHASSSHHCCHSQRCFPWSRFWTACGMLVLFACALIVVLRWSSEPPNDDAERAIVRVKNLAELRTANEKMQTTYGWVDQAHGVIRLPIDRAMELEIVELNNSERHPKAAYPIAPIDLIPKPAGVPVQRSQE